MAVRCAVRRAALTWQTSRAVKAEDYDAAKRLKDAIERLKQVRSRPGWSHVCTPSAGRRCSHSVCVPVGPASPLRVFVFDSSEFRFRSVCLAYLPAGNTAKATPKAQQSRTVGARMAKLELRKKAAVENEDYDTAKMIK
eukprot:526293-Rhodomonas_salina.1